MIGNAILWLLGQVIVGAPCVFVGALVGKQTGGFWLTAIATFSAYVCIEAFARMVRWSARREKNDWQYEHLKKTHPKAFAAAVRQVKKRSE